MMHEYTVKCRNGAQGRVAAESPEAAMACHRQIQLDAVERRTVAPAHRMRMLRDFAPVEAVHAMRCPCQAPVLTKAQYEEV